MTSTNRGNFVSVELYAVRFPVEPLREAARRHRDSGESDRDETGLLRILLQGTSAAEYHHVVVFNSNSIESSADGHRLTHDRKAMP